MNDEKYVGKVKNDGTYTVKVPALKAKDKVVVKAANRLGKSLDRKVAVKKKRKPEKVIDNKPTASPKPAAAQKTAASKKTSKKSSKK